MDKKKSLLQLLLTGVLLAVCTDTFSQRCDFPLKVPPQALNYPTNVFVVDEIRTRIANASGKFGAFGDWGKVDPTINVVIDFEPNFIFMEGQWLTEHFSHEIVKAMVIA